MSPDGSSKVVYGKHVCTSFTLQVWIISMVSQQVVASEDRAVHNPPPPPFQVGCSRPLDRENSLESLTGTREREG